MRAWRKKNPADKRDRRKYSSDYGRKHKVRIAALKRQKHARGIALMRIIKATCGCQRCGFSNPLALQFHHRNPDEKLLNISTHGWRVSRKKLFAEIAKCDVLCANCHFILHAEGGA